MDKGAFFIRLRLKEKKFVISNLIIIMASSARGQYAANSVFRLATRAGKME